MRLLLVIAEMVPGGAERIVIQLAGDAVDRGDDVMVATAGGAWLPELEATGADVELVAFQKRAALPTAMSVGRLATLLRRFRPDLVHTHNARVTVATRLAMLLSGRRQVPLLTTLHGLAPEDYGAAAKLLRATRATVIACAPSVGRSLTAAGFPAGRTKVVMNGAALDPAGPARGAAMRARLGLGEGPVVAGIGRLVPQKSWSTLVEAAAQLPDVQFVVAGDGPLRDDLVAQAAAGAGRVQFPGVVDDVAALLGIAACVTATSVWEGLPLSLLEALSLGRPAVVTAVDGITDVVPEHAALLVPPGDPSALARGLKRVLADDELAAALGREARRAATTWSPATMLQAYRDAYAAARHS
ncbi:MAG: hypothetical protein QOG64_22 [Acidimicrobiaceae bacterium]|nr:hypothetical protein [Acidimicrobiaceae bacterium]